MGSRIGKYFGSSGHEKKPPKDEIGQYKDKAEDWVRKNPTAAVAIAALAGAMLLGSPALRKLAIPVALMAMRRWMR